jgi:hypothetical protein
MRAADIVRRIWGDPPLANAANAANAECYSQDSQHSQPIPQSIPTLSDLLAQHGGFPGIDWPGLSLTDAQESALWIVQRPDGLLTVLATVAPIYKPLSYQQAWPARFTRPEPDDAAPALAAAQALIARAREAPF